MLLSKPISIGLSLLSFTLPAHANEASAKVVANLEKLSGITVEAITIAKNLYYDNQDKKCPELFLKHEQLNQALTNATSSVSEHFAIVINIQVGGPSKRLKQSRLSTSAPSNEDQEEVYYDYEALGAAIGDLTGEEVYKSSWLRYSACGYYLQQELKSCKKAIDAFSVIVSGVTPNFKAAVKNETELIGKDLDKVIAALNRGE